MKNFEYAVARSEADVLELLSAAPGKAEILAGGTDLVGLMKSHGRHARPSREHHGSSVVEADRAEARRQRLRSAQP